MEDPTVRARAPATLLRACERSRLEGQLMNDAYECLVPIVKCRCGLPGGGVDRWPVAPERGAGEGGRARCAGGVL